MKPIGRAQGKGIFLFKKLSEISKWRSEYRWKPDNSEVESYIVQRYIANPYLVGGKKFDMRLYVLVTSYSPLTAYQYRSVGEVAAEVAKESSAVWDQQRWMNTFCIKGVPAEWRSYCCEREPHQMQFYGQIC